MGYEESTDFTEGITPMMLASIKNDFDMVQMLLRRGHFLHRPHLPTCMISLHSLYILGVVATQTSKVHKPACEACTYAANMATPNLYEVPVDDGFCRCQGGQVVIFEARPENPGTQDRGKIWDASRFCVSSLRRGHANLLCLCRLCKSMARRGGIHVSLVRFNSYRAICSPVYICQTATDPIYIAFLLDREVKMCSQLDTEFKSQYLELSDTIRQFAVDLLEACPSLNDVPTMLAAGRGYTGDLQYTMFPRLYLALEFKQKEFVAHARVQQVVKTAWYGAMISWPRKTFCRRLVELVLRLIQLPIMTLLYASQPHHRKLIKWRCPLGRFLAEFASYLVFLGTLLALIIVDSSRSSRGAPSTGTETITLKDTLMDKT
ncbi:hypothetical protein LAZ67_3001828 [Cordylochernes scorpioides]|uniref:Transient receptor ion channel domain-containing protein n=1 Tax=Cordylochernes scorpioides TaxID=51811 RepID=A0ABY6K7A0_9ARAC|nr:hypothetical protein LAZ67_3001828 [Cordylochernes scorpioides]